MDNDRKCIHLKWRCHMRYIYNIEYSRIEGNNPHLTVSLVI